MRKDWAECKLGAFVEYEKGKKPKLQKPTKDERFRFPYINIKAFEKGIIDSYTDGEKCRLCKKGDFLMVWDGARLGLVGKAIDGVVGSTLMRINFPEMSNEYAYFFLKSKYREINTKGKGTGTPHINPDLLWNYIFPVPPLPEQKAIAKKIESLFSLIDSSKKELEKNKERIKIFKQAILKKAFDGELLSNRELEEVKKNSKWKSAKELLEEINPNIRCEVSGMRKDWAKCKLSDICEKITKVQKNKMEQNKAFIYLDIGGIDSKSNKIISHKSYIWRDAPSRAKQIVKKGDILFSTVRTYLKNIAMVSTEDYDNEICSSGFTVIRSKKNILKAKLVFYMTIFEGFLRPLNDLQTGTSYPAVRDSDVLEQTFFIPPFSEQKAIVKKIESLFSFCDKLEKHIEKNIKNIDFLRESILKKAFEGKLLNDKELKECRKSPDWKSGKELLEEIKKKAKK